MIRKVLAVGAAVATMVSIGVLSVPVSAATGGGCHLIGKAAFTPNGPGTTATFRYTLSAKLDTCLSNRTGAPTAGTIKVGQKVTKSFTVTLSNGTKKKVSATYQAPLATGSGAVPVNSCAGGTTAGIGTITWTGGSTTIVMYTTTAVTGAVGLQGAVVSSVTLKRVSGSTLAPRSIVIKTTNRTYPVGEQNFGALAFTTLDPTGCSRYTGLTGVDVEGGVGFGSPT